MNKIYLIARYQSTCKWLSKNAEKFGLSSSAEVVLIRHVDDELMANIKEGDTVVGKLHPITASELCVKGAKVYSFDFIVPPEARKKDCSLEDSDQPKESLNWKYKLTPYYVKVLD
jgi:putative CRISPR-associated protein (TIGR02620 family)